MRDEQPFYPIGTLPPEIAARAAEIRAEWDEMTEWLAANDMRRRGQHRIDYPPPANYIPRRHTLHRALPREELFPGDHRRKKDCELTPET